MSGRSRFTTASLNARIRAGDGCARSSGAGSNRKPFSLTNSLIGPGVANIATSCPWKSRSALLELYRIHLRAADFELMRKNENLHSADKLLRNGTGKGLTSQSLIGCGIPATPGQIVARIWPE